MKSASVKVIESWNVFAIALTSLTDVTWKFLRPSPLAPLPLGEGDKSFLDFAPPLLSGRGGPKAPAKILGEFFCFGEKSERL